MIELLIVIMVIVILMSLLVSAAFSFIVNAREAATATTISKVDGLLQERIRSFRQYDFSDSALRLRDAWNMNPANSSDQVMTPELAEVLLRKPRFKQAFPQSFTEADRTRLFPGVAFTYAAGPPVAYTLTSPVTGYDTKYECGIVLYAFLTKGETFGAPSAGDDAFTGSEVRVGPETNNLPCLVDAWGEPLRFYRWPTRLIRCGEQDFNGSGSSNDFNENGSPDPAGGITATTSGSNSILTVGAAIRPFATYPGPTPASLLISNLPPYERTSSYALGADGGRGVAGADDDLDTKNDNIEEKGWPGTDDPELLNTDPDDPTFRLSTWFDDPNINATQRTTRRNGFVTEGHDFYTFHTPLVVSSGPDKQLGLYEPTNTDPLTHVNDPTTFGHLAAPRPAAPGMTYSASTMRYLMDNITNLNQRTGGK